MLYRGGDLPIIENCVCDNQNIKRSVFFENCIPLYNMISSKKNLGFVEERTMYTIYHSSPDSPNFIINQQNGNITPTLIRIGSDDSFDDKISLYLDKTITIGNL